MTPVEKRFVDMLRKKVQDFPELNKLTGSQENDDKSLLFYINMALDDYNSTPPVLDPVTLEDFEKVPKLSISLLLDGAIVQMMLALGILQTRNQLSYSDGGNSIRLYDKGPSYIQVAGIFANNYERKKIQLKKFLNAEQGWGSYRILKHYPQYPYY